jgi:hypothetical protein
MLSGDLSRSARSVVSVIVFVVAFAGVVIVPTAVAYAKRRRGARDITDNNGR